MEENKYVEAIKRKIEFWHAEQAKMSTIIITLENAVQIIEHEDKKAKE